MKKISLFNLFSTPNLRNRDLVDSIFNKINKEKEVELDFSQIQFISKSFANELSNKIKESKTKIHLKNKNEYVRRMLKVADFKPTFNSKEFKEISVSC